MDTITEISIFTKTKLSWISESSYSEITNLHIWLKLSGWLQNVTMNQSHDHSCHTSKNQDGDGRHFGFAIGYNCANSKRCLLSTLSHTGNGSLLNMLTSVNNV